MDRLPFVVILFSLVGLGNQFLAQVFVYLWLSIVIFSGAESPQLPIQWFGLIESKIRHLANNLEKECRSNLASARIWPKPFAKKAEKTNTIRQLWFIGLRFLSDEIFDYSRFAKFSFRYNCTIENNFMNPRTSLNFTCKIFGVRLLYLSDSKSLPNPDYFS